MGDGICNFSSLDSFGLCTGSEHPHRNKKLHHSEGGPWRLISSRRLTKAARISNHCWSGVILGDSDTERGRRREDDDETPAERRVLEEFRSEEGDRRLRETERQLLRRLRQQPLEEELPDRLRPVRFCMRPLLATA